MFHRSVRFIASLFFALSFSLSSLHIATAGKPFIEDNHFDRVIALQPKLPSRQATSPPVADFLFTPNDPSIYDLVQFNNISYDPDGIGFKSATWNFGDGSTSTQLNPVHQYAADGDFTVNLVVTTNDDRTASVTHQVSVRTHDIEIIKISAPKVGMSGQWWRIHVDVGTLRYVETVQVTLYKSIPSGYQVLGSCTHQVPENPHKDATRFTFYYTFNLADAQAGVIHFKAVASITTARDAIPANNEALSTPPTQLKK